MILYMLRPKISIVGKLGQNGLLVFQFLSSNQRHAFESGRLICSFSHTNGINNGRK